MTARTALATDAINVALIQNRLDHIARHMGWVMVRTSRSPIFNQSHDFSCYITDANGMLVSQADGIPIHTGGGGFAVRAILDAFAGRINEGDVFLSNDPYTAGGNHLPDWVIARPVFVDGILVAFSCNRAHQSDIGGGAAGTYNAKATEIFHEGIRLPVLKLVEAGSIRDDLWKLLILNTRCPELLDGDLHAMLGATRVGAEEIARLGSDYGREAALELFAAILDHGERRLRAAVAELPDGVYQAEEHYDTDCFDVIDIFLRVTLTKQSDSITVDFTGTDPQIKGFKNSSLANTHSAVYAAVASFFDVDIPRNEGTFRCLKIVAPEGTVVNAKPPAPLTMCTVFPAHEIMHMVWWALGQAAPERSIAGWGKNCFPVSAGSRPSGDTWVMYNWGGASGAGAVKGRDGFNQMGPMITLGGLVIPNAETYEQLYPVTIHKQELHEDGGGAGLFRGGTGILYEVDIEVAGEHSFRAEGVLRPTGLGVQGGKPGAKGEVELKERSRDPILPPPYGVLSFGPCHITVVSPGGGGYGDPRSRPVEAVMRDVRDELVSVEGARRDYGVVLKPDGKSVDIAATGELRKSASKPFRALSEVDAG